MRRDLRAEAERGEELIAVVLLADVADSQESLRVLVQVLASHEVEGVGVSGIAIGTREVNTDLWEIEIRKMNISKSNLE